MKTIMILAMLIPFTLSAQLNQNNHLIKARKNAYASMFSLGIGSVMAAGMLASDPENAAPAGALLGVSGTAALMFQIFAWHHVGEAGESNERRRISYFITPTNGGINISLNKIKRKNHTEINENLFN